MGTTINASGILEVDLVFPRNDTYAPTDSFPVVFAFQNAQLARYLNPRIDFLLWNLQADDASLTLSHDLGWKNWTEDTYLAHKVMSFPDKEGRYKVSWTLYWDSCDEYTFENPDRIPRMIHNRTTWATYFTIDNLTDKTMKVPSGVKWSGKAWNNNTCAVVADSTPTPTPTPDPCRVHIDKAAVASIEASVTARICRGINPPDYCPKDDKNAATQLAVAGLSCLLAVVGAMGFFLA
jgi:hypothetical protein